MPLKLMSTEEYKNKVKDKYGDKVEILSEYLGGTNPIDILYHCNKHGDVYKTLNAKNVFAISFQPCKQCNSELHSKKRNAKSSDKTYFYNKLKNKAQSKGGVLLSDRWITAKTTYEFMCSNGHIFKTTADCINSKNQWCPYCYGRRGDFEEEIKSIAKFKNGEILTPYINSSTYVKAKCNIHNYEWDIMPLNIKKGRWCPVCSQPYSENVVYDFLIDNNFKVKVQYTYDDLVSEKDELLRFDFAVFNQNKEFLFLLEVDDKEHRGNPKEKRRIIAMKRDIIKNKYCEENSIILYRMIFDSFNKDLRDYNKYYKYIETYFKQNKLI